MNRDSLVRDAVDDIYPVPGASGWRVETTRLLRPIAGKTRQLFNGVENLFPQSGLPLGRRFGLPFRAI
jgi:hypothetical protein